MELSIIIVNYNTVLLLKRCLDSVFTSPFFLNHIAECEIYVVDNASNDGSITMVKKNFPRVIVIENKANKGFAVANNQALQLVSGKYILLLNSDTILIDDAIGELLKAIKQSKRTGVVGGKLQNSDGSIQHSIGFLPTPSRIFYWMTFIDDIPVFSKLLQPYHIQNRSFYNKKQRVGWVSGACFMIKKEILDRVGLLDEKIFMYGEEVEWCYRIQQENFDIVFTPKAQIVHEKGASGLGSYAGIVEEFSSILYLYKKHRNWIDYCCVRLLLISGALLRLLLFGIIGRDSQKAILYAKAVALVRR